MKVPPQYKVVKFEEVKNLKNGSMIKTISTVVGKCMNIIVSTYYSKVYTPKRTLNEYYKARKKKKKLDQIFFVNPLKANLFILAFG